MVVVIGVMSGLLLGVYLTCLWGLRKARGVRSDALLVVLLIAPLAYFWGAEAFGWPTPRSAAEAHGLVTGSVDRALVVGIIVVTAVVTVAVLVRTGMTRRLERWSGRSE